MNSHGVRMTALVLIVVSLLTACGNDVDLGPLRAETRQIGSFDSISMNGTARLEVVIGDRESLSIEGRDEVISRLTTNVRGDTLYIRSRHKGWIAAGSRPRATVRVTMPRLVSLELEGGNDVRLTGFAGGESKISTEGAAYVKADGRLDELTVVMVGAGHADLGNLVAGAAKVTVSGVGSVFVHPADTLDATMNGVGAILYTGSPRKVDTHMNGLGTIGRKEGKHPWSWGDDKGGAERDKPVDPEIDPEIDPDTLQPEYDDKEPAAETMEVT